MSGLNDDDDDEGLRRYLLKYLEANAETLPTDVLIAIVGTIERHQSAAEQSRSPLRPCPFPPGVRRDGAP